MVDFFKISTLTMSSYFFTRDTRKSSQLFSCFTSYYWFYFQFWCNLRFPEKTIWKRTFLRNNKQQSTVSDIEQSKWSGDGGTKIFLTIYEQQVFSLFEIRICNSLHNLVDMKSLLGSQLSRTMHTHRPCSKTMDHKKQLNVIYTNAKAPLTMIINCF